MNGRPKEPVSLDGILRALENETAKLDSLQSLCLVVAEGSDTFSDAVMTGSVFAIMNSVEATKDRLADVADQVRVLEREGGKSPASVPSSF